MAKTDITSVEDYIAAQPAATQHVLRRVRSTIRKALPGAEETISYRIPAYRVHARIALFFAGWKEHYALYPASAALVEAFRNALAPYELGKGTIRFPLSAPVPTTLIARIAKFRAREVAAPAKARAKTKAKIR